MQNLDCAINEYLRIQTSYSILITGKWGVGKTFYFKNTLTENINQTPTFVDASRNYKSIHISLFGLSSIEDIQAQIFLSLQPYLRNKTFRLSRGLGKAIARGILSLNNLGNVDDYISDLKPYTGDLLNLEELVLCFDDLERMSKTITLHEFLGYINSMVENDSAKVILIANADQINDFDNLKEKVVGITVDFVPQFEQNLKEIITQKYASSFRSYTSFLNSRIDFFLELEEAFESNLRVLTFCLDKLHLVYSDLKNEILDKPGKENQIIEEKLEQIIRFTIAVSIEHKNNQLTFTDRKNIDKYHMLDFSEWSFGALEKTAESKAEVGPENEMPYSENFKKKYFGKNSESTFFESIYAYVTGGNQFDIELFKQEAKEKFHIHEEAILPQFKILEKLNYRNHVSLSDKEYSDLTERMIQFAEQAEYDLRHCVTVFHFATRFGNIMKYDIDELTKRIENGLSKAVGKYDYDNLLEDYLSVPENDPNRDKIIHLIQTALRINEQIKENSLKQESLKIISDLNENPTKFIQTINDKGSTWAHTPILHNITYEQIHSFIKSSSLANFSQFVVFISKRYRGVWHDQLNEEISFLNLTLKILEEFSRESESKNRRNYFLDKLKEEVAISLKRLEA